VIFVIYGSAYTQSHIEKEEIMGDFQMWQEQDKSAAFDWKAAKV
jgi:hypothetical protein